MSIESYQRVLATNLMGEFYGCKFAIPHLRKTKGSIINMSSILSKGGPGADRRLLLHQGRHQLHDPDHRHRRGPPRRPGERHLPGPHHDGDRLQGDGAGGGPGGVSGPLQSLLLAGPGRRAEEVGTAALFLASSWAGYITGVTLNVSGGMEFGTIPKYYAFDASAEKMKNNTQEEN